MAIFDVDSNYNTCRKNRLEKVHLVIECFFTELLTNKIVSKSAVPNVKFFVMTKSGRSRNTKEYSSVSPILSSITSLEIR